MLLEIEETAMKYESTRFTKIEEDNQVKTNI